MRRCASITIRSTKPGPFGSQDIAPPNDARADRRAVDEPGVGRRAVARFQHQRHRIAVADAEVDAHALRRIGDLRRLGGRDARLVRRAEAAERLRQAGGGRLDDARAARRGAASCRRCRAKASIRIGAAASMPIRPGTGAPSGRPTQTPIDMAAVEADRPGVAVAVGRAGLEGDRAGRDVVGPGAPARIEATYQAARSSSTFARRCRDRAGASASMVSGTAMPPRAIAAWMATRSVSVTPTPPRPTARPGGEMSGSTGVAPARRMRATSRAGPTASSSSIAGTFSESCSARRIADGAVELAVEIFRRVAGEIDRLVLDQRLRDARGPARRRGRRSAASASSRASAPRASCRRSRRARSSKRPEEPTEARISPLLWSATRIATETESESAAARSAASDSSRAWRPASMVRRCDRLVRRVGDERARRHAAASIGKARRAVGHRLRRAPPRILGVNDAGLGGAREHAVARGVRRARRGGRAGGASGACGSATSSAASAGVSRRGSLPK